MNDIRAVSTEKTNGQNGIGLPNAGARLQVSSSALRFDPTNPGEESFLTLRITPPQPNTLVVVTVDEASLFQVAAGVERLAFKQTLTFKPETTGSYIHLRYTPERSGRHQSTVTVEVPATAETIQIPVTGRTSGVGLPTLSGSPAAQRPISALTKSLLAGGLLVGIGYAGYTYRCQLWPDSCGPSISTSAPAVVDEPVTRPSESPRSASNESQPAASESTVSIAPAKNRPASKATERTQPSERPSEALTRRATPTVDVPAQRAVQPNDAPARSADKAPANVPEQKPAPQAVAENTIRKALATPKPAATQRTRPTATPPAPKPVTKPNPTEESELERVLNREP
ncbi:hypothetical protein [Fibrella forsythiae]|uniref:Uncharacterized protein n=1 Tax=Fibrella forsythiae TaxID=2817061 RepID=A0ABS3JI75_9BACT|nr:hypothetical protein [Fibrella forsythiae]MBO0949716.1 hypothetical protein [Fibrella forsythiae]